VLLEPRRLPRPGGRQAGQEPVTMWRHAAEMLERPREPTTMYGADDEL
jgi:hypothetical protein